MRLINADDAEKYLYEHLDDLHVIAAQNAIDEMPTIDARLMKYGRWSESWRDPKRNVMAVICSSCGNISHAYFALFGNQLKDLAVDDVPKKICIKMPYCPNCGAKMLGGVTND